MRQEIYILVDCDGETICAFADKETAIKEAEESGCDVEVITLHS
jgi:hypothetical protein